MHATSTIGSTEFSKPHRTALQRDDKQTTAIAEKET
jgi:hypothetical protein